MQLLSALMDLGPNGHISSFILQLKTWNELLSGKVEQEVKQKQFPGSGEPATQTMSAFEVEAKEVHWLQAPEIYTSDNRVKMLQHISVHEGALISRGRDSLHLKCFDL